MSAAALSEMRIQYGPGYRVYFITRGAKLIILLCGGDKDSQHWDIEQAKRMATEWRSCMCGAPYGRSSAQWEGPPWFPAAVREPRPSQRPLPLQQARVRDPQRNAHSHPPGFLPRHAQEVDRGEFVLEDDEEGGRRFVVIHGPRRREVAQVGCEPDCHGDGPDGAALPFEEERQRPAVLAQDAERVGPYRVEPSAMPEEPRGAVGRVELRHLATCRAGLSRKRRGETVDGLGVLDVPEQLAAPCAGDVAPCERSAGVDGGRAPPPAGGSHGHAVPACEQRQPPVGEGEAPASPMVTETVSPSAWSRPMMWDRRGGRTPSISPR